MTTKVGVREDHHDISVFWVIDKETDTVVGSTHTRRTARTMASDHEATTHHSCRIRRVMMTEDHASHDNPTA